MACTRPAMTFSLCPRSFLFPRPADEAGIAWRISSLERVRGSRTDLAAMAQEVIRQNASRDGLADRNRPDAHAGVVPPLGPNLRLGAGAGDAGPRREDRRGRL